MTNKAIQKDIDKYQLLKKQIEDLIQEKESSISVRTRTISVIDKEILNLCEVCQKIYDKLTKDAAINRWSISDYNVNDYFDYETFDYDVTYLK